MPVVRTSEGGNPGYRWGTSGKVYTYRPGDKRDRRRARLLAARQGKAIRAARADADPEEEKDWEIVGEGEPNPGPYEALLGGWAIRFGAQVRKIFRRVRKSVPKSAGVNVIAQQLVAALQAEEASGNLSPDLTVDEVRKRIAPAARRASRRARASTVRAGVDTSRVRRGLLLPKGAKLIGPGSPDDMTQLQALEVFAQQGVELIKTVPPRVLDNMAKKVAEASIQAQSGVQFAEEVYEMTAADLLDIVNGEVKRAKYYARRIARDQTNKLNGEIVRATQSAAGITKYRWRSSRDRRTRDWHRDLSGNVYEWSTPPKGGGTSKGERGHPGSGIQCRCVAIPIVD